MGSPIEIFLPVKKTPEGLRRFSLDGWMIKERYSHV